MSHRLGTVPPQKGGVARRRSVSPNATLVAVVVVSFPPPSVVSVCMISDMCIFLPMLCRVDPQTPAGLSPAEGDDRGGVRPCWPSGHLPPKVPLRAQLHRICMGTRKTLHSRYVLLLSKLSLYRCSGVKLTPAPFRPCRWLLPAAQRTASILFPPSGRRYRLLCIASQLSQ